ncbi:hypothetical protein G6F37_011559 [Rhizopus arrhizus]|nr:hypothetical protein G6F38_009606 [Rhizopus arrhizus]KAG1148706.1 hypothetical protein G6F37_011559 [Rhizopus arrhizus]
MLEDIRKSEETASNVKRVLNSILPKMKASKPKEVVQVKIKNKYTQCAVSNSGNASLVLNSLASNENSDSSGSNKSEIEEGSELQIPVSHDDFDALDSLFKNPLSTPVPSLSPSEFRRLVYIYGSKAVSLSDKITYVASVRMRQRSSGLDSSDGSTYYWKRPSDLLQHRDLKFIVKHRASKLMIMNSDVCQHNLNTTPRDTMKYYNFDWSYKTKSTVAWLDSHQENYINDWSAQSPDFNSIEHLSKTFYITDAFALESLIKAFNPAVLGEQLDVMSVKLAMAIDPSNIIQVNALKLSLSRIIDTVNDGVISVFRQYLSNQFWERLNDVDININEGMSTTARQLYQEIMTRGTVNDKIDKKEIRIAISEEKLSMLKFDQTQCLQILDILDLITKHCLTDRSICFDDDASELTCYRKFAKILDEILDNTMLDILDGERVSKASKTVATNLEKIYNANIPLNNGFGRRIDLILATKGVELSTSEWKRKKSPAAKCLQQQAKNIRINKAILRYFLVLPISEADKKKVMTIGMDWTGAMGYMFAVKPLDDVFVASTLYTLAMPTYIDELPSFIDTLDHLYSWRNYHVHIKDIVLEAICKREKENFFSSILDSSTITTTNVDTSPNIYLTPTRSHRRRIECEIQNEEQEYQEEYQDEDE